MKLLDLTLPTPAENLALDEALLDAAEAGQGGEVLRFWESPAPFVVVGFGNSRAAEVNLPACEAAGVPVLRRASGGGTVVQGPGCLNYAVILRTSTPELASIPAANRAVMERNRAALQALLPGRVAVQGHTDLTWEGLKFSGNAQRRKREHLLFHGTFLLGFDLTLVARLLRMPTQQPTYRQGRAHEAFICNIPASAPAVRTALATIWNATPLLAEVPLTAVAQLCREKYAQPAWNQSR